MEKLVELERVEELLAFKHPLIRSKKLGHVQCSKGEYPVWCFEIGAQDPTLPVLGLFGGVHGLEKIGSHVVTAYLHQIMSQLQWDQELQYFFERARLVSIPIVNPGGMALGMRSNPQGVDIMRNAPITSSEAKLWPICGQSWSNKLPWYRGAELQAEAKMLIQTVEAQCFKSSRIITLDVHSGFGLIDRLWYPYAKTKAPFPYYDQAQYVQRVLGETFPHHIYALGPQSQTYITHGDLWDYLVDDFWEQRKQQGVFIPWTLELGSWQWVRKRPIQVFSALGIFNPMKQHRYARTMRRHILLIDLWRKLLLHPGLNDFIKG